MINTLSMFDFTPDIERENEVLHGDKDGFAAVMEDRYGKSKFGN